MVLRLRMPAPDWTLARCLGQADGPEYDPWFSNEEYGYEDQTELGLEICNGGINGESCPVRHVCLTFALTNNERYGVWGGTSEIDRRALRKMWPWPGGNDPHPEWQWYPPGEVARMLPDKTRATLEQEDDDDDADAEAQQQTGRAVEG